MAAFSPAATTTIPVSGVWALYFGGNEYQATSTAAAEANYARYVVPYAWEPLLSRSVLDRIALGNVRLGAPRRVRTLLRPCATLQTLYPRRSPCWRVRGKVGWVRRGTVRPLRGIRRA